MARSSKARTLDELSWWSSWSAQNWRSNSENPYLKGGWGFSWLHPLHHFPVCPSRFGRMTIRGNRVCTVGNQAFTMWTRKTGVTPCWKGTRHFLVSFWDPVKKLVVGKLWSFSTGWIIREASWEIDLNWLFALDFERDSWQATHGRKARLTIPARQGSQFFQGN